MFSLIVLTTVVLVFVYKAIVWYSEFSVLKRKVNLIPGPSGWPFIGSVPELLRSLRTGDFTRMMFQEYPEKYGRIFRFWIGRTPRIVLCSAKHVEPLLNSTRLIKKSVDYDLVRDWLGDGLLISSGDKWRTRRRLITPTFHFTILNEFVPVFISNAAVFAEVLRRKKGTDEPFDVFPLASLCALDIICDCAMGVEVNAQMGQDSDYVTAVKRLSNIANTRSLQPWYASDFVFNLSPEGREHKQLLKKVHAFTEKVISRRRGELQCESVSETLNNSRVRKRAFLDLLLSSDLQLTDSDVQEEVDTFMFEGHDTTAAGISWCLYALGLNPDVQEKAYEEVTSVIASNGGVMDSATLHDMKYLECCIKEAQRLYPSVPFIAREVTEDFQSGEYTIPKGAQLSVLIMSVHRDPEVYPEPQKYNPDRFFIDEVSKRHPYAFVPFSAGPRNCIGQKFAVLEEKAVVATVIKNFRIKSRDDPSLLKLQSELILKSDRGLYIDVKER